MVVLKDWIDNCPRGLNSVLTGEERSVASNGASLATSHWPDIATVFFARCRVFNRVTRLRSRRSMESSSIKWNRLRWYCPATFRSCSHLVRTP